MSMKTTRILPALGAGFLCFSLAGCFVSGGSPAPTAEAAPFRDILYVADRANNLVDVVDTTAGQIITKIPVGSQPSAIAAAGIYVFVLDSSSHDITVIDHTTNTVKQTITAGSDPIALSGQPNGASRLAVLSGSDRTLTIFDADHLNALSTVALPFAATGLLAMDDEVALLDRAGKAIHVYDTISGKFTHTFTLTGTPLTLADDSCGVAIGEDDGSIDGATMDAMRNFCGATGGAPSFSALYTLHAGGPVTAIGSVGAHEAVDASANTLYYLQPAKYSKTLSTTTSHYTGTALTLVDGMNAAKAGAHDYGYLLTTNPDEIKVVDHTSQAIVNTFALPSGTRAAAMVSAPGSPVVGPAPTATPAPAPTPTPTPVTSASTLYVANGSSSSLESYAFPLGAGSVPNTVTMPGTASGVAYDGAGTLAVQANSNVYLYAGHLAAGSTPVATLATNLSGQIAFDRSGNLYVPTDFNSVLQFKKPFVTGESPQVLYVCDHSSGVAFDASGTMYVANFSSGNLNVVAPPYANNSQTTIVPAAGATLGGVAISGNTLYVSDTAHNVIYAYALPLAANSTPLHTYAAADPEAIAFDANGFLYVSNDANNRVDVYNPPSSQAALSLAFSLTGNGLNSPFGLAVAP